ncbi:MAG TPA: branched-chain amino acid ABC transporter substrate-binding protein, partial [Acidimicrobiia bacterium]|nr:branched-chain amino acid ABC transporter substrate-binding protein [Acidimicrobiia bacterium]
MSRKSIRLRHLVAMTVALALVAAACGDDGGQTEIEDAIGVVEIQPGEQIQIRAHQAISDVVADLGLDQVRGIEMAIEDFGDIHGFSVNLGTPEDDLCLSAGGQTGAQAIAAQDGVLAVIGTTCSGAGAAALPVYSSAGLVMISGSNTSPSLTSYVMTNPGTAAENYLPGYYRTAHNDEFQGGAVADFVYNELGLRRAAAVHDGDPYTEGLTSAFSAAFEALGGEVPYTARTQAGDQTSILTDIAAADVDLVFFPIFPQTGGPEFIQQKDSIAGLEDIVWFSADGLFVSDFLALTETEGVYFSGPDLDLGANVSETGVSYADMLARYETKYGVSPPAAFHAHSYDATVIVLTAIREVGVLGSDGVLRVGRQALRDYISNLSGFAGLIGPLGCDEFGDCGS